MPAFGVKSLEFRGYEIDPCGDDEIFACIFPIKNMMRKINWGTFFRY